MRANNCGLNFLDEDVLTDPEENNFDREDKAVSSSNTGNNEDSSGVEHNFMVS